MIGRLISYGVVGIAQRHLDAIKALQVPKDGQQAKRLLAFLNYFRDYCPRFSERTFSLGLTGCNKYVDEQDLIEEVEDMKTLLAQNLQV